MNFDTPIAKFNQVGAVTAKRLKIMGIEIARDLLYFFPFRYEDFRTIKNIAELKDGDMVTIKGKIELINNKRSFRAKKIITEALISDSSDSIRVVWFGQPFIKNMLKVGDEVFLSGKVKEDMLGTQMVSPVYEKDKGNQTTHTARLVPIYPSTANLTQKQIRFLVSQVIDLSDEIDDWLPQDILEEYDLVFLNQAIRGIHYPVDEKDLKQSTDRLKFDELFLLQLKAEFSKLAKSKTQAVSLKFKQKQIKEFVNHLPFKLTTTQKISAWEILKDIQKDNPMSRLLSGDVGSGKTVVAGVAIYNTILNGYQAVLMAPTEILAVQHYNTIQRILGDKLNIGLLTHSQFLISSQSALRGQNPNDRLKKADILYALKKGKVEIIVGTHALLSDVVEFQKLGLVVVDEQHRFGVEQRKMIKDKGDRAHFLSMTATPIPRSLALLIYGDLDVSIINELPVGRKPILTRLVDPINRQKAYEFIREQVKKGRQVFVVCPLIEDKDASDKKSVMAEYEKLSKIIFPDLKIGYLHGKLKPSEKEAIMNRFSAKGGSSSGGKNNEINILVSTSVIEVGIDMPNASVMMIEDAERFGLAQLHQFRGRVGRSDHQSYCFLFMTNESAKAKDRLKFFEKNNDGFKLAEKDLEIRGPGEVYGTAQSGLMNLRLAKLTDRDIIKKARDSARVIINNIDKYPKLIAKVKEWEKSVHLE